MQKGQAKLGQVSFCPHTTCLAGTWTPWLDSLPGAVVKWAA